MAQKGDPGSAPASFEIPIRNVIGGLIDVAITLDLVKMERLDEAFDNAVTDGPIVGGESG